MPDVLVRLTTSLARHNDPYHDNGPHQYRPGEKYRCPENEAKAHIANGSAEPCAPEEPDYIPPDGTDARMIVNKTVREQTTAVQPRRAAAAARQTA